MVKKEDKRGIAFETLIYWIIAIGILALMVVGYMILTRKGETGISIMDRIFRSPVGNFLAIIR